MWTEAQTEQLKVLWAEGRLSCSQIAAEIGIDSRNAVIGKVHRLGLSGRVKPAAAPRQRKPRRPSLDFRNRTEEPRAMVAPEPIPTNGPTPDSRLITLAGLDMRADCRFICNDPHAPSGALYCGAPRKYPGDDSAHTYCRDHAAICFYMPRR